MNDDYKGSRIAPLRERLELLMYGLVLSYFPFLAILLPTSFVVAVPIWLLSLPLLIHGCLRTNLLVSDEGLRVRNFFRTQRLTWEEIDSIIVRNARLTPTNDGCLHLVAASGGRVALLATLWPGRKVAIRTLEILGTHKPSDVHVYARLPAGRWPMRRAVSWGAADDAQRNLA
jgi:hypothetical protein